MRIVSKESKKVYYLKYIIYKIQTARPKNLNKIKIDGIRFITRYVYVEKLQKKSRKFCQK